MIRGECFGSWEDAREWAPFGWAPFGDARGRVYVVSAKMNDAHGKRLGFRQVLRADQIDDPRIFDYLAERVWREFERYLLTGGV